MEDLTTPIPRATIDGAINITTGTLKYQKILVLVLALGSWSVSFIAADQVFYLSREHEFLFSDNDGISGTMGECLGLGRLGCSVIYFLSGVFFGSIFIAFSFADRYGRKLTIQIFSILGIISMIFTAFSISKLMINISAFANGVAYAGVYLTGIVLCVESVDFKHRALYFGIYEIMLQVGLIVTIILFRLNMHWRYVILFSTVPLLIELCLLMYIQESPRFLLSIACDMQRCIYALGKISWINSEGIFRYPLHSENILKKTPSPFRDILKSKIIIGKLVISGVIWIFLLLSQYSMIFMKIRLGDDLYLETIFDSIANIISIIASVYLIQKYGRKKVAAIGMLSTGVLLLIITIIQVFSYYECILVLILSLALRAVIGGMIYLISLFTAEQFPTSVRCTCFYIANGIGIIGAIVPAVLVSSSTNKDLIIFSIISGIIIVLACPVMVLLEETHLKELDEIPDYDFYYSQPLLDKNQ